MSTKDAEVGYFVLTFENVKIVLQMGAATANISSNMTCSGNRLPILQRNSQDFCAIISSLWMKLNTLLTS